MALSNAGMTKYGIIYEILASTQTCDTVDQIWNYIWDSDWFPTLLSTHLTNEIFLCVSLVCRLIQAYPNDL